MRITYIFLIFAFIGGVFSEKVTIKSEGYQADGNPSASDCPNRMSLSGTDCLMSAVDVVEDINKQHDYEAGVIGLRTQMLAVGSKPVTRAAITDLSGVGSDNSRYVKITTALDTESSGALYDNTACTAEILNQPDSELYGIAEIVEGAVASGTEAAPECSVYLSNHEFLGSANVKLTISGKTANDPDREIIVSVEFTSHANDPEIGQDVTPDIRDLVISYGDGCVSPGGYLKADKGDSACNNGQEGLHVEDQDRLLSESTAKKGTVTLKLTGVFLDKRYKVKSQSGVAGLPSSQGDFLLVRQGLELGGEYQSFNTDPSLDENDTGGDGSINLTPIEYKNKKSSTDEITHSETTSGLSDADFSNRGRSPDNGEAQTLSYAAAVDADYSDSAEEDIVKSDYDCDLSGSLADAKCYAQYVLSTEASFTFHDMPHFQASYISCGDACPATLAIKGFKEVDGSTDVYRVNALIPLSADDMPSAPADFDYKTVKLLPKPQLLLLPGQSYKMSNFFSVEASEEALRKAGDASLDSLDDEIDFSAFLTASATTPDGTAIADAAKLLSVVCSDLKETDKLTLSDLEADIVAGYTRILEENCRVHVENNFYGSINQLSYNNDDADNDDAATAAEAIEIDNRELYLVDPSTNKPTKLSLLGRTDATALRVATTISMQLNKFTPDVIITNTNLEIPDGEKIKDQPIIFRLAAESRAFKGFVNTGRGGAECAGNNIFFKSTERAKRIYKATGAEKASPAAWEIGLPYGTCDGSTMSGVLSSADADGEDGYSEGELVQFKECKLAGGEWKIVSVPDATYEDVGGELTCTGAACDSSEGCSGGCTGAVDLLGYSLSCASPAIQEQVLVMTSGINGKKVTHNIESTTYCAGTLDFQLEDQTRYQEFAIYKVRIPCSRVSTEVLEDKVDIKYAYESTLNLADDTLEVIAKHSDYLRGPNAEGSCTAPASPFTLQSNCGQCDDESGVAESECGVDPNTGTWEGDFTPEYTVKAQIGICDASNEFDNTYTTRGVCALASDDKFTADGSDTQLKAEASSGLEELMNCARSGADGLDESDPNNYIITYDVAMQYTRTVMNKAGFNNDELKFCDDQAMVATINRQATASVTSAGINQAELNRAVLVQDIGWIEDDCGSGSFRLEVLLAVKDSDNRDSDLAWTHTKLTAAFMDVSSSASNPNNMEITPDSVDHVAGAKAEFKVRGACIAISKCVKGSDLSQNGDSWEDFSTEFRTDMVVRGTFLNQDVDTAIQMTLNFEECPADGDVGTEGEVRVGLATECDAPQNAVTGEARRFSQSIAQPLVTAHITDANVDAADETGIKYDCTAAYADDVLRVEGFEFVGKAECSSAASDAALTDSERTNAGGDAYDAACALLKDERDVALDQEWTAIEVKVSVERWVTVGFLPPYLEESVDLCECSSAAACTDLGGNFAGLPTFNRKDGGDDTQKYLACGAHADGADGNAFGTEYMKHQIPLMPFSNVPGDAFVVHYEVVLKSGIVVRRLRASTSIRGGNSLQATGEEATEASAHGVKIISENDETGDGDHDHDDGDGDHTHDNDHTHNDGMTALIVIICILVAGGLGGILYFAVCKKKDEKGSLAEKEDLIAGEGNGYRQQRFKNLRY